MTLALFCFRFDVLMLFLVVIGNSVGFIYVFIRCVALLLIGLFVSLLWWVVDCWF